MDDDKEDNYAVGYRKPPKHTRFKKGQSGNPSGKRQRSKKKIYDLFEEILGEKLMVLINGKKKKTSKIEVAIRKAVQKALEGDFKFLKLVLEIAKQSQLYEEKIITHDEWVEEIERNIAEATR